MSSSRPRDPSWAEVRNFIQFLNAQLHDCEQSPYCVVDELKGFKEFVVKFAILMAKVNILCLLVLLNICTSGVHRAFFKHLTS